MTEPLVGVVMGSASDWETMQHCAAQLEALGVPFETRVLSAHRTPRELSAWIEDAESRGVEVFIAAAGMAAALPYVDVFAPAHNLESLEKLVPRLSAAGSASRISRIRDGQDWGEVGTRIRKIET